MNVENIALKLGLSKEELLLIAAEIAIITAAVLTGAPATKIGKLPL